jgi:hypothetical protein
MVRSRTNCQTVKQLADRHRNATAVTRRSTTSRHVSKPGPLRDVTVGQSRHLNRRVVPPVTSFSCRIDSTPKIHVMSNRLNSASNLTRVLFASACPRHLFPTRKWEAVSASITIPPGVVASAAAPVARRLTRQAPRQPFAGRESARQW